jgi:peroxiredoxin-like protein
MKPLPHLYEAYLAGGPVGYATVSATGLPELRTAEPADFDGPGDAWSPEHLLLAAVQTCFIFTLRAVARAAKIEFTTLQLTVEGKVDRESGATRFTEIILRPALTVAAGTDRERALHVIERSERACLVSASLKTPIRLEPIIEIAL